MKENEFYLCLILLILFTVVQLQTQEKAQRLIFSEVYFDKEQPKESWIEIYNPTDKPLILEGFRISRFLTNNMLRDFGVKIKSNEYVILCEDKGRFKSMWGENIQLVGVGWLSQFRDGGYIALITKGMGYEAVRYGNPAKSAEYKNICTGKVLSFLKRFIRLSLYF